MSRISLYAPDPVQSDTSLSEGLLGRPNADVLSLTAAESISLIPLSELTFPGDQRAFVSAAGAVLIFDGSDRLVSVHVTGPHASQGNGHDG